MEKIVFDKELQFALKFIWKEEVPYVLEFQGVEVVPNYVEDKPVFYCFDDGNGMASSATNFEAAYEAYKLLEGFIKWDGCMEIHDFNHHWCYKDNFAQRIVDLIYEQAKEIMKEKWSE